MNTSTSIPSAPETSSFKMLRAMVGIGIICALLIVLTYEGTLPRVQRLKAAALEQAILRVIPGATIKQDFTYVEGEGFVPTDEEGAENLVYAGYNETGEFVGLAIPASGMGFADVLRILYGYDPAQQAVVGFYVLESKETPGLGDKIEKDEAFLANFKALDVSLQEDGSALRNEVLAVKHGEKEQAWEIDAITGATISSWAIGDILGSSTAEWIPRLYQHRDDFVSGEPEADLSAKTTDDE
jgi:electron transport complex protein RnfG